MTAKRAVGPDRILMDVCKVFEYEDHYNVGSVDSLIEWLKRTQC